jgi:hypothetical protein
MDAQDTPPVDEACDIPREPISEQESQIDEIRPASSHLVGLPKVYFYSGCAFGRQIDFELLRYWMYYYEVNHRCYKFSEEAISRLRVIDIYERCVVEAPPGCRYVALSYVWGSISISDTKAGLPGKLPQTIEDAISAVKELGERYLWVDALCIAQDDPDDKMAQIQNMDQIYSNAVVTFIAGEGNDSNAGLPGVRPSTRTYQQYSEIIDGLTIYVSTPLLKESILPPLINSNIQNVSSSASPT